MKKTNMFQKMLSVFLALCMVLSWALPANAYAPGVGFTQVSNDRVSANLIGKDAVDLQGNQTQYAPNDIVRVSIFLDKKGVLDAGFAVDGLASNASAQAYREKLQKSQNDLINKIEKATKEKLDVVWNLTLSTNLISANVKYSQIATISAIKGVKNVVIEAQYEPDVATKADADPNMATSGVQTGTAGSYASGYTGAGTKVAIIDTGLDIDHLSYNNDAYLYSLSVLAERAGLSTAEYLAGLNLMNAEDVAAVWDQLNASERTSASAEELFISDKIPYGFNYVDSNLNVTHLYDDMGEHGSHVAGIATANAYVPTVDGAFASALDSVFVQGVAPDAQVIVMKVFGASGGAYQSDYMAAIEDAIVLGVDSINLSLGSGNPGFSAEGIEEYDAIFDSLEKCGVVVTISAGNSGSWMEYSENGMPYMYLDDVSMHTSGSPGTYTNSLGVASVNNAGFVSTYVTVNGQKISYAELFDDGITVFGNQPFVTLAGTREYVFVNGIGTEEDFAALGEGALNGKIAICYRGTTSFYEKANAAVAAGAAGVIIVNNQAGTIYLNLTGYLGSIPVISMTMADGELLKQNAVSDEAGNVLYWTGTMDVSTSNDAFLYQDAYYTMSSFSSWGVPSSLEMKPEITAPGGSILSVGGAYRGGISDHESYEIMSGTSMAAPQVTGMAALLAQYIRDNDLVAKTGLDARTLAQSLLMSTAEPILDGNNYGYYYPVLQQGAGLANVGAAMAADSYILMGADATDSYADGKVKVELGDDPDKEGVYTFSFSINNLTDAEETFALFADIFTQGAFSDGYNLYLDTMTTPLDSVVTYTVDGVECDTVNVAPNGSVTVVATITLSSYDEMWLSYYENGAYLEGYVYAASMSSDEGVMGTVHSIPVLGFYGNWSDASMYDKLSYENYVLEGTEDRAPYMYESNLGYGLVNGLFITYAGDHSEYYFGGNPIMPDEVYMPERNAISGVTGDTISTIGFTSIRNAGAGFFQVIDLTNDVYLQNENLGAVSSAYYYVNGGYWDDTYWELTTNLSVKGVADGTLLEVGMNLIPEYYVNEDGSIDWDALGRGTMFSMTMTVDNVAPVLNDVVIDTENGVLSIEVLENQYVAAVVLLDATGKHVFAMEGSQADAVAGEACSYDLSLAGVNGNGFLLQVYDYAMNCTTYEINTQIGEVVDTIDEITLSDSSLVMQKGSVESLIATVLPVNASNRNVTWSSSDETIALVDENGNVLAVSEGYAYVTATSVADPTVSASCLVQVIDVSVNLRGFVWDENGSIWLGDFNTATLPDYNKLAGDYRQVDTIAAACTGPDGTIYASSLNTSTYTGSLYTIDPVTGEITYINTCNGYFYSDMTYAENMYGPGLDALLVTYGYYVIAVDPTTGAWIEVIDEYEDILVGITTCYSYTDEYGDTFVCVYIAQADGTLYQEMYVYLPDYEFTIGYYYYMYGGRVYEDTGINVSNAVYFNSLCYDADHGLIFWSAFEEERDSTVTLYAIDEFNDFKVYELGQFAEDVWPVAGLLYYSCQNGAAEHTPSEVYALNYRVEDGVCCYDLVTYCTMCGEELSRETVEVGYLGDVDNDGNVDTKDANLICSYYNELLELTDDQLLVADVNGDGAVDTKDANLICSYYNELIDTFPVAQ